jgi:serine protease Do
MTASQLLALAVALAFVVSCQAGAPPEEPPLAAASTLVAALPRPAVAQDTARMARSTEITEARGSAIVEAAARVAPAVVSVNVIRRQRQVVNDPFQFFFMPRGYERLVQGVGSGFVVTPDGVVITNQHVTEGAEQIVVTTREGTDYPATLLGEDPLTDIAVVKIDGQGLPVAPLGRSAGLVIGEWVVAVGNPYGYLLGNSEPTVTAGVVSAVGRNLLPSSDQQGVYVGMIQTDAAINPGNSGGPLANALGEVVGVNSSILSQSGGSVGLGFAIPIERAWRVADELRRHGRVRRAWVGLDVGGAEDLRAWKTAGGLEVTDVVDGGPAAAAGLRAGDVLLTADGRPMRTFLDWEAVLLDHGPGDALQIAYLRGNAEQSARVTVSDLPTTVAEKISVLGDIQAVSLTSEIRQERDVQVAEGALPYDVGEETQGATGLRPGDVIYQINRQRVRSAGELRRAFDAAAGGGAITVWLERSGRIYRTQFYVR